RSRPAPPPRVPESASGAAGSRGPAAGRWARWWRRWRAPAHSAEGRPENPLAACPRLWLPALAPGHDIPVSMPCRVGDLAALSPLATAPKGRTDHFILCDTAGSTGPSRGAPDVRVSRDGTGIYR